MWCFGIVVSSLDGVYVKCVDCVFGFFDSLDCLLFFCVVNVVVVFVGRLVWSSKFGLVFESVG